MKLNADQTTTLFGIGAALLMGTADVLQTGHVDLKTLGFMAVTKLAGFFLNRGV